MAQSRNKLKVFSFLYYITVFLLLIVTLRELYSYFLLTPETDFLNRVSMPMDRGTKIFIASVVVLLLINFPRLMPVFLRISLSLLLVSLILEFLKLWIFPVRVFWGNVLGALSLASIPVSVFYYIKFKKYYLARIGSSQ